jgi:hypothetical protein
LHKIYETIIGYRVPLQLCEDLSIAFQQHGFLPENLRGSVKAATT